MKEVKKELKRDFELVITNLLETGKSPVDISKELNISLPNLSYYLKSLKKKQIIKKVAYGTWEVNKELKKSSLGTTRPLTNLHALQIHADILSGTIDDKDWEVKEKLNNWFPKYTELKNLGGLVLKNNNNKSLTIWAEARDIKDVDEIRQLCFQIRIYIYNYFRSKYNVELDLMNMTIKNLDVATEDNAIDGKLGKGEKFELKHGVKAEKIFENDDRDSKSWMDGSPFKNSVETNDIAWKREYLRMPFSMQKLLSATAYIAENYKSHVGVVEELHNLLKDKKARKIIKEKVDKNNQYELSDF